MRKRVAGFTMVEVVLVLLIGGILTTISLTGFRTAQTRYAARGAKTMYATLHQRARARAIEMGETVRFIVDMAGDSAYMVTSGGVSDVTRFRSQLNVDLRSSLPSFQMCMTPRGYADPNCSAFAFTATSSSPITLEFWMNSDSTSVIVLPMGQLVGL